MPVVTKPRAGSMAFYPRVKAKSIIPKFGSFDNLVNNKECKPLCFYGVKAGMTHIMAKDAHKGCSTYGQEIAVPVSVLDVPELKVIGARLYKSNKTISGKKTVYEFLTRDNTVQKKIKGKKSKNKVELETFLKKKDEADDLVVFAMLDTKQTSTGQKKPVIVEVPLSGSYDDKINYLKDKYNKTISITDVTPVDTYLDVKSVTIGHGTTGPVKRFGIKIQRPKCQQHQRHVGSIGPWHPAGIMYTVARTGQHGFHNRTTFNKKLVMVDADNTKVNPKGGFKNYGLIKNSFALIAGTIPGPTNRVIVIRPATRNHRATTELADINYIAK